MRDWEAHYRAGDTPWNRGGPAPPLFELLEKWGSAVFLGGPVLVPGCGYGHDVRALVEFGIPALGLDISASAVETARALAGNLPAFFEHGDFLDSHWRAGRAFPAIWEHTCFCAISPHHRTAYAESAVALLPTGGIFAGVFYLDPHHPGEEHEGPPFGCSIEELDRNFTPWFERIDGWMPQRAYSGREGREWIGIFRKLPNERVAGETGCR